MILDQIYKAATLKLFSLKRYGKIFRDLCPTSHPRKCSRVQETLKKVSNQSSVEDGISVLFPHIETSVVF